MDTKKRPNEDSLKPGPESSSLAGLAEGLVSMDTGKTGHAISTLMDVDAANRESSSALTTPAPNATAVSSDALQPSNEANKRIKLTIDADKSGAEYSPSLDVADPSEESKGLAEWVEKMDDDDNKEKNDVESAAEPVLPSTKAVSAAVSQDGEMSKSEANADAATTLPNPSTTPSHNLVHALVTAEAAPSASELTGSILAVASLSEPLVTTLETLETGIQTVDSKAVSQPTEAATIPADNSPLSLISTSVTKDSEALTAINDKTGTQEQTQDVNEESITQSTKEDAIPNAPNGADPSEKESNQSSSENRQHSQAERPQSPTAGRTPPEHTLPPLSSLSTTPALSDPLQNTRPSRSTMSVSALLLNNDDDSEQEQERERRMSRNIFDQFEIPHPDSSSITSISTIQKVPQSSTPSIPPPQRHSPALSSPSATQAQLATSGQAAPPSISPRPTGAAGNALRSRDQVDSQPMNQNQAGFNRAVTENNQSSGRRQDPTRATPSKDYPADEVMESGGIGLFGSQRHRLASPVGVRPLQEPINGLGGAGPVNGKLPGLVSVTSIASTHIHDPHGHPGSSYRGESSHGLMAGRSSPYSAGQHATASHPPTVNGHLHYPSTGHTGHHSGIAPAAPIASMTSASTSALAQHPRLIVKNDPSLTKSDRPEFFLGYYRYEPSLLLPDMQGKENSLLEVRIASSYLTYDNIKVKRREIWGTDIYTDDSDVVAMLIHGGLFIPPISAQSTEEDSIRPTGQQHNFAPDPIKHICPGFDLAVTLRILPKLVKYQGSIRNRIKSRTWSTGHDGVSFKIESIRKMCPGEALNRGRSQSKQRMKEYNQERLRVLANIHDETTESLQNEKAMRTATFEFTHQGDPCFKYSPELVMDRHDGLSRKWTSWRLKNEVLILENDEERYEISLQHQAGTDARRFDQYRFAVISGRTSLSSWSKATYPLDFGNLAEVLYEDLDWQDFEWVERGVVVQPSQRVKGDHTRSGFSSLMEGIEPTNHRSKDAADESARAMEVGDNGISGEESDGARKAKMALDSANAGSSEPGAQKGQQDGVFCVVSRLFWRPRTEQRLPRPSSIGSSMQNESKTERTAVSETSSSTTVNAHSEPWRTAPGEAARGNATGQVTAAAGGSIEPAPGSTPSFPAPIATTVQQPPSQQATAPSGFNVNTMDVDMMTRVTKSTVPEPQQPSGDSSTKEAKTPATASVSEDRQAEREEGELEEGEIASD